MKTLKKIIPLLLMLSIFNFLNSQNKRTRTLIEGIQNDYAMTNNKVVYLKVYEFEGKSNEELFDSALDFLENYTEADLKITSSDPNRGKIRAWGFYKNFNNEIGWGTEINISASYSISVDIKENKGRIKVTLADYFKSEDSNAFGQAISDLGGSLKDIDATTSLALYKTGSDLQNGVTEGDFKVVEVYPFNLYSKQKNIWGRSFYYLNNHVVKILPAFQKFMKENINDKW